MVTEVNTPRELLTILALLSIVPLDIFDTRRKEQFAIKLANINLEVFDSETNRRKLVQKNIEVVQNFNEEEGSMIIARIVLKLCRLYTERELDKMRWKKLRKKNKYT